jgi:hypothetical protein
VRSSISLYGGKEFVVKAKTKTMVTHLERVFITLMDEQLHTFPIAL